MAETQIITLQDQSSNYIVEHWKNKSLENLSEEFEGIIYFEQWKPIHTQGFEDLFEVSTFGRVKGFKRWVGTKGMPSRFIDDLRIVNQAESDERGYVRVCLSNGKSCIHQYVHILVGKAFIPNPLNKRTVNHKRGNKKDNRAWMLEWNTYGENHTHSYRVLGRKHSMKDRCGYSNKKIKEVLCLNNNKRYGGVSEAARELGLFFQNVSKVCRGKRKHTMGYVFKFVNPEDL